MPPNRTIENQRYEIESYLDSRGIEPDAFYLKIRQFLDRSRVHYRCLLIRDQIAAQIDPELDPTSPGGQKKIWEEVIRVIGADKATLTRWNSGQTDPPWEQLIKYFDHTDCPGEGLRLLDRRAAMRFAIARTLTYILVYPWSTTSDSVRAPDALQRCWKIAENHKYHQRFSDINQNLLDRIVVSIPKVMVKVDMIGGIRKRMEGHPRLDDPLYWPFAIFKLATFSRYSLTDPTENAFQWIWQDQYKVSIWGMNHETQ